MALHRIVNLGPDIVASTAGGTGPITKAKANSFTVTNSDGTTTVFQGQGLTYETQTLTDQNGVPYDVLVLSGGTVTAARHFSASGRLLDTVTGLALTGPEVNAALVSRTIDANTLFTAGGTTLDGRAITSAQVLFTGTGDDTILGGIGNDSLFGRAGNDILRGNLGNDMLSGGEGDDQLFGGLGTDTLWGGTGNDALQGGTGEDTAFFASTFKELTVTKTATGFSVTSSAESANGLQTSFDTLVGVERISTLDGIYKWNATSSSWAKIAGPQSVDGLHQPNQVYQGTAGAENLTFVPDASMPWRVFNLGAGDDTPVFIYGGDGADTLKVLDFSQGVAGRNVGAGKYFIFGGNGDDTLQGGVFGDDLAGGCGNDVIISGNGDDRMAGGDGADTFVFRTFPVSSLIQAAPGNDVISDFALGTDALRFDSPATLISIVDTADGLFLTFNYEPRSTAPIYTGTILLEGVHGNVTLEDLLA
jgi:Ca2+-binding RTX toxin-like protein